MYTAGIRAPHRIARDVTFNDADMSRRQLWTSHACRQTRMAAFQMRHCPRQYGADTRRGDRGDRFSDAPTARSAATGLHHPRMAALSALYPRSATDDAPAGRVIACRIWTAHVPAGTATQETRVTHQPRRHMRAPRDHFAWVGRRFRAIVQPGDTASPVAKPVPTKCPYVSRKLGGCTDAGGISARRREPPCLGSFTRAGDLHPDSEPRRYPTPAQADTPAIAGPRTPAAHPPHRLGSAQDRLTPWRRSSSDPRPSTDQRRRISRSGWRATARHS